MEKEKIRFQHVAVNSNKGNIWRATGTLTASDENTKKKYSVVIELVDKVSTGKSPVRIDTVKEITDGSNPKSVSMTVQKDDVFPRLYKSIPNIEHQFSEFLDKHDKQYEDFYYDPNITYTEIPSDIKVSTEDIQKMLKTKDNSDIIYSNAILKKLKDFEKGWSERISNSANDEREFQNYLLENTDLFTLLFGFINTDDIKKEGLLDEGQDNKTDISNDDWIIELKKPNTKLFTKKSSRNNIYGITNEFASAANQTNLYKFKQDRTKEIGSFAHTKGVLIIGMDHQFEDDSDEGTRSKKLTWDLFCENQKIDIYTFDGLLNKIRKIISDFSNNLKRCAAKNKN